MANGQQIAAENVRKIKLWIEERKRVKDYLDYEHQGRINRSSLSEELGFARSVVTQNGEVNRLISEAEELWFSERQKDDDKALEAASERSERKSVLTAAENSRLMDENAKLRAENAILKSQLRRYAAMAEVLAETGIAPR